VSLVVLLWAKLLVAARLWLAVVLVA